MRVGGGKDKGSVFERKVGSILSLWITNGERADLFSRNVLSGGKYTQDFRKGKPTGMPGDLIAAHPLAFEFLSMCLVEAKHHKDLLLEQYVFQPEKSHLGRIIKLAFKQGCECDLQPLIIARQNHKPIILITNHLTGLALLSAAKDEIAFHWMHSGRICLTFLDELLRIDCKTFLQAMKVAKGDLKNATEQKIS